VNGIRNNYHRSEESLLLYPSIKGIIQPTEVVIEFCHYSSLHAALIPEGELHTNGMIADDQRGFQHYRPVTAQMVLLRLAVLMAKFSRIMGGFLICLRLKATHSSKGSEVSRHTLIKFRVPMKIIRATTMY
jgi:hypothetical protein